MTDRRAYWKQRYDARRAEGLCVTSGCSALAVEGKTLCEKHAARNRWAMQRNKERQVSERERLPEDRAGTTVHFTILAREEGQDGTPSVREVKGYITSNTYPDGRLGEIFVRVGKAGSSEAWIDVWAIACSIALQRGATVDEVFGKFVGQRFEPSGSVKWLNGMTRCTSVVDAVSRYLIGKFGEKNE
jgi:hypothetical protein